MNSPPECFHKPRQPHLQGVTPPSILGTYPISQLGDDDGARVTAVLFLFEPGDDPCIAVPLGRLADDVRIEQPTHSFRRRAGARRRGGTSSGLTGQALSPVSQFSLPGSRRNTSASSSGSKLASK